MPGADCGGGEVRRARVFAAPASRAAARTAAPLRAHRRQHQPAGVLRFGWRASLCGARRLLARCAGRGPHRGARSSAAGGAGCACMAWLNEASQGRCLNGVRMHTDYRTAARPARPRARGRRHGWSASTASEAEGRLSGKEAAARVPAMPITGGQQAACQRAVGRRGTSAESKPTPPTPACIAVDVTCIDRLCKD
jgi:hypothetical protein